MAKSPEITPRLVRFKLAPGYVGMNRNLYNELVRHFVTEIRIGKQGVAFDRLELDAWVDDYISRNGRPGLAEGDKPWQSIKGTQSGGLVSLHQTDSEYDNLLGLKKSKKHKSLRTGSKQSFGEHAN